MITKCYYIKNTHYHFAAFSKKSIYKKRLEVII